MIKRVKLVLLQVLPARLVTFLIGMDERAWLEIFAAIQRLHDAALTISIVPLLLRTVATNKTTVMLIEDVAVRCEVVIALYRSHLRCVA